MLPLAPDATGRLGSRATALACAAAVALAGLVYLNALDNPFVYDDLYQIVENRSFTQPSLHALVFQNTTRPVLNISYALDRWLWGPAPFGFHVTNVTLHMLNVGLLLAFALIAGRGRGGALGLAGASGAALVFAVHPMMTQAVGYISGRSEVLCATWFLLALLAADRWIRGRGNAWLAAALGAWALALGTKETAVMFPAVLFVYDRMYGPGGEAARRRLWRLHLPVAGAAIAAALARIVLLGREGTGVLQPQLDLVLVELGVVRRYVWMLLAPSGQAIVHRVSPISGIGDPQLWLAIATVGGLIAVAWVVRRRQPMVTLGLVWCLLLLVPGFVLVALDRGEPMAEHRVYLAAAGLFLAAGAAADWLLARGARRPAPMRWLVPAMLALGVVSLAGRTVLRNIVWSDPEALWREALAYAPDFWLPYVPLGDVLHARGRHAEAAEALATALRLRPESHVALGKLGVCLVETGRLDDAEAVFERLRAVEPTTLEVPYGLGLVAVARGDAEAARGRFAEVLAGDPLNVPARQALATLEETSGANPAAALRYCEEVRQIAPDTPGNDDCISRNQRRLGGH